MKHGLNASHLTNLADQFTFVASILGRIADRQDRYGIVFFPARTSAKKKNALRTIADQLRLEGVLTSYDILRNGFIYGVSDIHPNASINVLRVGSMVADKKIARGANGQT